MTSPSDRPPGGDPLPADPWRAGPEPEPAAKHRRPWAWITASVVLLIVAGGFAVWAFGLQGDLDDQKDQTAQAQQDAEQAQQAADQANDAMGSLADQLDQLTQDVEDAGDEVAQAGDDAKDNAQSALDGFKEQLAGLKEQVGQGRTEADAAPAEPVTEEPQATATP